MSNIIGYNDLPEEISNQIRKVVNIWKKYVNDYLVGIYIHGSIVLNAFNPKSGDINILVVVNKSLDIPTKQSISCTGRSGKATVYSQDTIMSSEC